MSLFGSDFDPITPRDTDARKYGASEIRDIKRRLKDFLSVTFDLDTGKFKSANSNITIAASDPTNPNLGDVYFNSVSLTAFVFTSAGWVQIQRSSLPFSQQYFSATGSFTVPVGVRRLRIHAWGAGGGGFAGGSVAGGGGGGGGYGSSIVDVTPGDIISFTVGTGGAGGSPGVDGGNTVILGRTAHGGAGAVDSLNAGAGGVVSGFDINLPGQSGAANMTGASNVVGGEGGDAGGSGGNGGMPGSNTSINGRNGTAPGGGGCGSENATFPGPGDGAAGGIIIEY